MAFASVGTLGSANTKSSGTTVGFTVGATAEAGNLVVVYTAWNNVDTVDGDTTRLSCDDSQGNTYTLVSERTESSGAADDGITVALFYSVLDTTITAATDTITITGSTTTAKAVCAWEFTMDESSVEVEDFVTQHINDDEPPEVTLSSLADQEHLFILVLGQENNVSVATTWDADYTAMTENGTTGGGAATNVRIDASYRILDATTDAHNPATSNDVGANIQIYAAFNEVAGGSSPTVTQPAAGIVRLVATAPAVTYSGTVTQPAAGIVTLNAVAPAINYSGTVTQPAAGIISLASVAPAITYSGTVTQPAAGIVLLQGGTNSVNTGEVNDTVTQPAAGIINLVSSAPAVNVADTVTQPAAGIIRLIATGITGLDIVNLPASINPITFLRRRR